MNDVCSYIMNHYQDKSIEFFPMSDIYEYHRDNGDQVKYIIDTLTSTFNSNFKITEYKFEDFDIDINIIYDGYKGCIYTYRDSDGYDYWVVNFSNLC